MILLYQLGYALSESAVKNLFLPTESGEKNLYINSLKERRNHMIYKD